ncbi:hypothetical protein AVI52_06990 [Piscirickettsia salmonis]|nr:hypothetical protein AVI52_06990 [Piscirickettsia salmonis]
MKEVLNLNVQQSVVGFMNMDLKSLNGYGPTSAKRVPPGGWMKHWLKLKGAGINFIERLINMAILWIGCSVVSNMLKRPCTFSKRQ